MEQQRRQEDVLLSGQVTSPAFSSTDSSPGGVAVSFSGLYDHIDTTIQRPPEPSSPTLRLSRPLPPQLNPSDPLARQFVRGIAQIRIAGACINEIDEGHVRLLSRDGQPHLGGGVPAAREARRALREAETDLHEALETAIATAQQNRTDRERLADLRAMLERLRGWIADKEDEAVTYATRMENELACLTQRNARLECENQAFKAQQDSAGGDELADLRTELRHTKGWITDKEIETANYATRVQTQLAYLVQRNTQLERENRSLRTAQGREVGRLRAELARRNARVEYLEREVAEYAGYN
jgi:hypothetical protein